MKVAKYLTESRPPYSEDVQLLNDAIDRSPHHRFLAACASRFKSWYDAISIMAIRVETNSW